MHGPQHSRAGPAGSLTENPYSSMKAGPNFGPTLWRLPQVFNWFNTHCYSSTCDAPAATCQQTEGGPTGQMSDDAGAEACIADGGPSGCLAIMMSTQGSCVHADEAILCMGQEVASDADCATATALSADMTMVDGATCAGSTHVPAPEAHVFMANCYANEACRQIMTCACSDLTFDGVDADTVAMCYPWPGACIDAPSWSPEPPASTNSTNSTNSSGR